MPAPPACALRCPVLHALVAGTVLVHRSKAATAPGLLACRRRRQPPLIAAALPKLSASLDEEQLPLHTPTPMCRQRCGGSPGQLQLCQLKLRSVCHAGKRAAAVAAWREQQQQQQWLGQWRQ